MNIFVINPNTSKSITEHIYRELERIKRVDTEINVQCNEKGPETIDSEYHEVMTIPYTLDLVKKANIEGYDAVIIAAFPDPGLIAAREISNIPVFGIEEVALHIAAMLGAKFTVITTLKQRIPSKRAHVHGRGLDYSLASVRSLDQSTAENDLDPRKTKKRVIEIGKEAIKKDGAEVIILGCAGMAGYSNEIEAQLGIPVIDPTTVTFKIVEAMVDLGLKHSKIGLFAQPPDNPFR